MSFYKKHIFLCGIIFLLFISKSSAEDESEQIEKAYQTAMASLEIFIEIFQQCLHEKMPHMQFLMDNLQGFVNYPSKTTVGLAPKFTGNRKFFANMITTPAFKEMLAKDEEEIWTNYIQKVKYCDDVVKDQKLLKEMYDRELDQFKL